jgi:hypothetical protein
MEPQMNEGQPVKCDENEETVYRYTNKQLQAYPDPIIASSWDPAWNNFVEIDCSGIPIGPVMELTLIEGQAVSCDPSEDTIYRYTNETLRAYPSPEVASSWDSNWAGEFEEIHCDGIPRGPDMHSRVSSSGKEERLLSATSELNKAKSRQVSAKQADEMAADTQSSADAFVALTSVAVADATASQNSANSIVTATGADLTTATATASTAAGIETDATADEAAAKAALTAATAKVAVAEAALAAVSPPNWIPFFDWGPSEADTANAAAEIAAATAAETEAAASVALASAALATAIEGLTVAEANEAAATDAAADAVAEATKVTAKGTKVAKTADAAATARETAIAKKSETERLVNEANEALDIAQKEYDVALEAAPPALTDFGGSNTLHDSFRKDF